MKLSNRAAFQKFPLIERTAMNDFCLCRVLKDFMLVEIESVSNLRAAKARMRKMAQRKHGTYLVFSRHNGQVLEKLTRRS